MKRTGSAELLELVPDIAKLPGPSPRILRQKEAVLAVERHLSIEQAIIITESYRVHEGEERPLQRAQALRAALEGIGIAIDGDELLVGNRTRGVRDGVVFPEAGISWLEKEIDELSSREQDPFMVRGEDRQRFFSDILPYWKGRTLEDQIYGQVGSEITALAKVVKINQKDHAQGHIIPDARTWLQLGPRGLIDRIVERKSREGASVLDARKAAFWDSSRLVLEGASAFMLRYANLAGELARELSTAAGRRAELEEISSCCRRLAEGPPESFREALQSLWFLFVILQMESNASSFSPGRADQYLMPFFRRDYEAGRLGLDEALELIESLFISFNKIVYMRNREGAKYFAGFPIGFNVTIGGQNLAPRPSGGDAREPAREGLRSTDAANALSFLILKAQEHLGMPQPNITARVHPGSSDAYLDACARVIGLGSGMPQIVNDESIVPALERVGIHDDEALDYGLVGCVELSTQGDNLGWSDAAMFNLVKALELTLNDGICLQTGERLCQATGGPAAWSTFEELLAAYEGQISEWLRRSMTVIDFVDRAHARILPSAFLSALVSDCVETGLDVTAGGARHNLSGIQAIQIANVADSLAVIKKLVYEDRTITASELLEALRDDWRGHEKLRLMVINKVPKYGNDVGWVDELGARFARYFADQLQGYVNARGGRYHMGLYTVSAHVPMGQNVGASPDGRCAGSPLADGGVSPMYGRDLLGPTAVLKSVGTIESVLASNGSLLNMKFVPSFFTRREDRGKFLLFLRAFMRSKIHHIQFNVVNKADLLDAQLHPEKHRSLTIRVAGYTAYFTELAADLQEEIIERTAYGEPE
jgi:formate C-acetyltransferase